jgi:CBS domain-containing protein
MNRHVVTILPDATLSEAAELLCKNELSGAPVVSARGVLEGFISETGLIDVLFDDGARTALASEYMTRDVKIIHPDDSLADAARMLALDGAPQLAVVENDRPVGIITRRELMRHALRTGELLTDPLVELIPWLAPMS